MNSNNRYKTFSKKLKGIYKDPLFILIIITTLITIYLLNVQMKIGVPYFDVFNYLNNGLYFAGKGNGNFLYLPPFIPILNSLFFRMGYISINSIFIIDSIIFIIGVVGLYLILNQRFNKIQSFTGSIIFISFPIIISWAASGGIDIPGITFSIWAVYFTILGVKKDSKFLYLVLPIIMLSFITRYTSGIIILPIFLYAIINIDKIKKTKKIVLGVILEFLALIMAFLFLYTTLGTTKNFYNLLIYVTTSTTVGIGDVAYNPNPLYYIQNILNYISIAPLQGTYSQILNPSNSVPSILSYLITLIALIGLIFYINRNLKIKSIDIVNSFSILKILLLFIMIIGFLLTFNTVSFFISEILFFGICYILYSLFNHSKFKNMDLDLMFFSWFGAYLIFHSTLPIKVDRYFITMAPAFVYFIILGLREFISKIKPRIKNKSLKSWGIYLIIALIFLSTSTATYVGHAPKKCFTLDIENTSNWLKEYDPAYKDKIIYSDYEPAASWYLKRNINGGFPVSMTTTNEFSKMLKRNNVDYYIDTLSVSKPDLNGYRIIKTFGPVAIYEKL